MFDNTTVSIKSACQNIKRVNSIQKACLGDILVIEFTYKVPDEVTYLAVVIMRLKGKVNDALISILSKSKCSIITSSSYSQCRWNAYYTTVEFAVALVDYGNAEADG